MVLIYIDNMAITRKEMSGITLFKQNLSKDFEIIDLDKLKFILSILVTWNHFNCLIFLNQSAYITQVLIRFGMLDTKPVLTPLAVKHSLSTFQSLSFKAELNEYPSFSSDIHYLSLVSSLLYAIQTYSDI